MATSKSVFLLNVSGDPRAALSFCARFYPSADVVDVAKGTILEQGVRGQLRHFRAFRGRALVYFFDDATSVSERQLKLASGLAHRCQETVFADETGSVERYRRRDLLLRLPAFAASAGLDALTVGAAHVSLRLDFLRGRPEQLTWDARHDLDVAYLYPFPFYRATPGGRLSFLRGSLSGLRAIGASCAVLSGCAIPSDPFPVTLIPNRRKLYLFKESQELSYNVRFALRAWRLLRRQRPRTLYQRHSRLVVAGALLGRLLGVPFILEYHTSEDWWARTWGSVRLLSLVRLAEDFAIRSASLIAVVSDVLREELLERGVPQERIIVNPAAVDTERFRPGHGGSALRKRLGLAQDDVVACFAGSFSYFHGISVLEGAIRSLMARQHAESHPVIRFLLIGDGPLRSDLERTLDAHIATGKVIFTGAVPPDEVPKLLDAADILLAPTVPMPDGKRFFGSPSKLFEYMSAAKAIIASDLEQLGAVLAHAQTAWLVPPEDDEALADAILLVARDSDLRRRLGGQARREAIERYTWDQNARRLFAALDAMSH